MGGTIASAPPMLIPPGGESVKNRPKRATDELLSKGAKRGGPPYADEIPLVDKDTVLPDDSPKHQAQSNTGRGQRHPKMGIGCLLFWTAKRLNHQSSGTHHTNQAWMVRSTQV